MIRHDWVGIQVLFSALQWVYFDLLPQNLATAAIFVWRRPVRSLLLWIIDVTIGNWFESRKSTESVSEFIAPPSTNIHFAGNLVSRGRRLSPKIPNPKYEEHQQVSTDRDTNFNWCIPSYICPSRFTRSVIITHTINSSKHIERDGNSRDNGEENKPLVLGIRFLSFEDGSNGCYKIDCILNSIVTTDDKLMHLLEIAVDCFWDLQVWFRGHVWVRSSVERSGGFPKWHGLPVQLVAYQRLIFPDSSSHDEQLSQEKLKHMRIKCGLFESLLYSVQIPLEVGVNHNPFRSNNLVDIMEDRKWRWYSFFPI